LYDAHSVLSVRFLLIVVLFLFVFYNFSLLRISWFRIILFLFLRSPSRLPVNGNERKSPPFPEHTSSLGSRYYNTTTRNRANEIIFLIQGWDTPTRFVNEKFCENRA
jgi:hypothetical protein